MGGETDKRLGWAVWNGFITDRLVQGPACQTFSDNIGLVWFVLFPSDSRVSVFFSIELTELPAIITVHVTRDNIIL